MAKNGLFEKMNSLSPISLEKLPAKIEKVSILKALIEAHKQLAELKGVANTRCSSF